MPHSTPLDEIPPPPPESRLAAAFWLQYNVILLLGGLAFSLSLASPVPAEIAILAEAVWIVVAYSSSGVQRWVHDHVESARSGAGSRSVTLSAALTSEYRARTAALERIGASIRRAARKNPGFSREELRVALSRLDRVRQGFLRLAETHQRVSGVLRSLRAADLEGEMARATEALAREKDLGVKLGLRQALALSHRRLQHLEHVVNTLRAIEMKMDTIETSFGYVESIVLGFGSGQELDVEIDALVTLSSSEGLDAEARRALSEMRSPSPSLHTI